MSNTTLVAFLPVSDSQARIALAAMKAVAAANGQLRPADLQSLEGAARHIFYSGSGGDLATMSAPTPEALAEAFPTRIIAATFCN